MGCEPTSIRGGNDKLGRWLTHSEARCVRDGARTNTRTQAAAGRRVRWHRVRSFFGADGEAGAGQVVLAIHAVGNDVGHGAQDTWGIEHRTDGVASCSYPLVGVVLTGWGSAN